MSTMYTLVDQIGKDTVMYYRVEDSFCESKYEVINKCSRYKLDVYVLCINEMRMDEYIY